MLKIDYRNGAGDGHIVWRLGQGGDFTVNSTDPNPWFSHQHNAHYIDDSTIILFDNGNTRQASDPNAHSRGQVWVLDEQTMTATLVVNADLGSYAGALGAAQRLSNGDYSFNLGTNGPEPLRPPEHTVEVSPDGTKVYDLMANAPEYRTFRVRTHYEGISDQRACKGEDRSDRGTPGHDDQDRSSKPAEPALPDPPRLGAFWATVARTLAASPEQSAAAATTSAPQSIPASTVALAPISETDADPVFQDVRALAAAAASDALFTDPGKDLWHAGLGDDLARVLSP